MSDNPLNPTPKKSWEVRPYMRKIELRITDLNNKHTWAFHYENKNSEFESDKEAVRKEMHAKLDLLLEKVL